MQPKQILDYIEKKRNYIENDFKVYFIFEVFLMEDDLEMYKKKMYDLERKMSDKVTLVTPYKMKNFLAKTCKSSHKNLHTLGVKLIHSASLLGGLSKADIAFIDKAYSDETNDKKSEDFLDAFEKLVSDPDTIPSNSVVILSQKLHYMQKLKRKADISYVMSEKRRKIAAQSKGQKTITDYFKLTKTRSSTVKTVTEQVNYKLEEIINEKRGCENNIKILWLPKNEELNPVNYVSVIFYKEVADLIEGYDIEPIEACKTAFDTLPNELWQQVMTYIEKLEGEYVKEYKHKEQKETMESHD